MRVTGSASLNAPIDRVWAALRDPEMLAAAIPGCERLDQVGPGRISVAGTLSLPSAAGRYTTQIHRIAENGPSQLTFQMDAVGQPGTAKGEVAVTLDTGPAATTRLSYAATITLAGPVAATGQRMQAAIVERLAEEFARAVERRLTEGDIAAAGAQARHPSARRASGPDPTQPPLPVPPQGAEPADNLPSPQNPAHDKVPVQVPMQAGASEDEPGWPDGAAPGGLLGRLARLLADRAPVNTDFVTGVLAGTAVALAVGLGIGILVGRRRR